MEAERFAAQFGATGATDLKVEAPACPGAAFAVAAPAVAAPAGFVTADSFAREMSSVALQMPGQSEEKNRIQTR